MKAGQATEKGGNSDEGIAQAGNEEPESDDWRGE